MKDILYIVIFLIASVFMTYSQSYPEPFCLEYEDYSLTEMSPDMNAGEYPESMIFHQSSIQDPGLEDEMDADWIFPYNLTSRSRINGRDSLGIQFYNTGSTQSGGGGFLGAAVLALNTMNVKNIQVEWTGATMDYSTSSTREYRIRLQYSTEIGGPFIDLLDESVNPSEFVFDYSQDKGYSEILQALLPDSCENREKIFLRWKYYQYLDGSGSRPKLRLDDIRISSEPVSSVLEQAEAGIDEIHVYPNPTMDLINFVVPEIKPGNINLKIYSLYGKMYYNTTLTANSENGIYRLNLSDKGFRSGIYIVHISNGEYSGYGRIIYNP